MAERIKLTLQDIRIIDRYSSKFLISRFEESGLTGTPVNNPADFAPEQINIFKDDEKIV